eukprot:COSAG01_NODE_2461_length_7653_cov_18.380593_6_plen_88_part_00
MKTRMAARRPASLQGTTRGFGQRIVNFQSEIEGKKRPGLPVAPDFRQEQRTGHAARPAEPAEKHDESGRCWRLHLSAAQTHAHAECR